MTDDGDDIDPREMTDAELREHTRRLYESVGWPPEMADPNPAGEVVIHVPPGWLSGPC